MVSARASRNVATLAKNTPAGHIADSSGACRGRLYVRRPEQDTGVGGLKTALPAVRDGFSPQQIDLGRYLFFDPVLSGDNSMSCAGCHAYDVRMIGPPTQIIQALYMENPQGIIDYITAPTKKREDYPEMPPQNYLSEDVRMAAAQYMLQVTK